MNVQYVAVLGFPSYRVGSDGSVWSCARGKDWTRLKPTPDKDGYNCIRLYLPRFWKQCRVAAIAEIRALKGLRKQREVAAQFGTTQSYVSEIWSGRRRTPK